MDQAPAQPIVNLRLARQPILDRKLNLVAFELLFRSAGSSRAGVIDDHAATADVIVNAFLGLGFEKVLGLRRGYINVDAEMLLSDVIELLPKDRVVLELLETVELDARIVQRVRELRKRGYRLALDDVTSIERIEPLLGEIDIVKVDVLATPGAALHALVKQLRLRRCELLAEKVESQAQARACTEMGFDLFQGYFFARPELLEGHRPDPSKLALVRLLALTQSENSTDALEAEIRRHPQIAYDLLRLVNSVSVGLRTRIVSLRRALIVLGHRPVRRWIQLLVFHSGAQQGAQMPSALMLLAATRAKMMERLAEFEAPSDRDYHDKAFLTGILSLLEALLRTPIADVVAALNPVDDVRDALLARKGMLGSLLALVERVEQGDRTHIDALLCTLPGLGHQQMLQAELDAASWASAIDGAG